jgi:hypothetical protein
VQPEVIVTEVVKLVYLIEEECASVNGACKFYSSNDVFYFITDAEISVEMYHVLERHLII